jgi:hypothetical protein
MCAMAIGPLSQAFCESDERAATMAHDEGVVTLQSDAPSAWKPGSGCFRSRLGKAWVSFDPTQTSAATLISVVKHLGYKAATA